MEPELHQSDRRYLQTVRQLERTVGEGRADLARELVQQLGENVVAHGWDPALGVVEMEKYWRLAGSTVDDHEERSVDADIISKTDPKHCSQWVNNLTVDDPEVQALIQENVRLYKDCPGGGQQDDDPEWTRCMQIPGAMLKSDEGSSIARSNSLSNQETAAAAVVSTFDLLGDCEDIDMFEETEAVPADSGAGTGRGWAQVAAPVPVPAAATGLNLTPFTRQPPGSIPHQTTVSHNTAFARKVFGQQQPGGRVPAPGQQQPGGRVPPPAPAARPYQQQVGFRTAGQQLARERQRSGPGKPAAAGPVTEASYGAGRRQLGTRPGPAAAFKPPVRGAEQGSEAATARQAENRNQTDEVREEDPRYKNIDKKMVELIENEIMDCGEPVDWADIAGLEFAKEMVREMVVLPMMRPDIFTGLRAPPKGLLLFGPPGTGKTLIGKCIASQSGSTFFSISASSLTSKWVGEGEKMVRALFAVAKVHQPAVVFIDEIDSLLTSRSEGEHESSRKIKTEFLVQLDGASTVGEERVLVVGATNRPQELDDAARRRLVKRLYIPLPEVAARRSIVARLLAREEHELTAAQLDQVGQLTQGYSGADMANLCKEAAMGPIRSMDFTQIQIISKAELRKISFQDVAAALKQVKASVGEEDLDSYKEWDSKFGATR